MLKQYSREVKYEKSNSNFSLEACLKKKQFSPNYHCLVNKL